MTLMSPLYLQFSMKSMNELNKYWYLSFFSYIFSYLVLIFWVSLRLRHSPNNRWPQSSAIRALGISLTIWLCRRSVFPISFHRLGPFWMCTSMCRCRINVSISKKYKILDHCVWFSAMFCPVEMRKERERGKNELEHRLW